MLNKNILFIITLLILAVFIMQTFCSSSTPQAKDSASNSNSGSFTFDDFDGKKVDLAKYKGKVVVLNFWAIWCKYCIKEFPDFITFYNKNKDKVHVVGINVVDVPGQGNGKPSEQKSKSLQYLKDKKCTFDNYFVGSNLLVDLDMPKTLPQTIILDANGNKVDHIKTELSINELETLIKKYTK